jgi:catechol 2,3-dioxygenase-like lactoylglutathione lyase family enzyme
MDFAEVTHVGINVPDKAEAERYYKRLFDLQFAWGDDTGPLMLWSGGFRLALSSNPRDASSGGSQLIGHVGLQVSQTQLAKTRDRALEEGCEVLTDRAGELFDFRDRYGIEWELDRRSFSDPVAIWHQVQQRRGLESP